MRRKLLGLALVINLVYVGLGVVKYGSQHVDGYGIWMVKAKAWVAEAGTPLDFLKDTNYSYSHSQYPMLLPAMMAGFTRLTGNLESFLMIYPLVYGLVLLVLYKLLRLEKMDRTRALAWTVAASFMGPLMAQGGRLHAGLADIWICVLVGLAMVAVKKKSVGWLTIIVAIASQIKMEGIFLIAIFSVLEKPFRQKLKWMGLAVVPFIWWQWQVRAWGLVSDIGFYWPGGLELLRRIGVVATGVGKEMINWRNWYLIWPIFGLSLVNRDKKCRWLRPLGLMTAGYVFVYLLARLEPATYVAASMDRIMLQLLPLWWVVMAKQTTI